MSSPISWVEPTSSTFNPAPYRVEWAAPPTTTTVRAVLNGPIVIEYRYGQPNVPDDGASGILVPA